MWLFQARQAAESGIRPSTAWLAPITRSLQPMIEA
jgi:hypothetical protein